MTREFTEAEMIARQNALGQLKQGASIQEWYSMQPKHVSRYAKPSNDRLVQATTMSQQLAGIAQPQLPGKLMAARFEGKCVDCGGKVLAGDMMRYDGQVHHANPSVCDMVLDIMDDSQDDDDGVLSDQLAEQRNERWFEERGGGYDDDPRERELWALEDELGVYSRGEEPAPRCRTCGANLSREHHQPWCDQRTDDEYDRQDESEAEFEQEQQRRDRQDQDRADAHSLGLSEYQVRKALHPATVCDNTLRTSLPAQEPTDLHDGYFTVVLANGERRTFRIRTQPATASFAPGEQVVSFLNGPDNQSEFAYTGFAFLKNGQVSLYKRFRQDTTLAKAAKVLEDPDAAAAAGLAYAIESGHCCICGHLLTVPASIHQGMGPDCAAKYSM